MNFEQNNYVKLLLMAKFAYNNAKNTSTSHTAFEFNCDYHPRVSYKEDVILRSKSKSVKELYIEVRKQIIMYQKNLYYAEIL